MMEANTMEQSKTVVTTTLLDSGILQISLNRPEQLNALSEAVLHKLMDCFQTAKHDKNIKAILLTGEGKGFCAGADIKQLASLNGTKGAAFARAGQAVFRELEMVGKPSLAAVHGFAFGGGCELAMAATIRIATEKAVFGQPEIKLGVIPGFGGTQRLARLVGKGRALQLCLTGQRVRAEEALQWGLVTEVVPEDQLMVRAKALLSELAQSSPIALSAIMDVIHRGYDLPLDDALELEAVQFGLCCTTADKQEGVSAFLEKRKAVFRGE